MLFMVIERFKGRDAAPIYARLREHGRSMPDGLRYPVETLLELLGSGMTPDEILADYEDLERDDLLAVLAYAAR